MKGFVISLTNVVVVQLNDKITQILIMIMKLGAKKEKRAPEQKVRDDKY